MVRHIEDRPLTFAKQPAAPGDLLLDVVAAIVVGRRHVPARLPFAADLRQPRRVDHEPDDAPGRQR
jgi:hypothetical protein